MKEIKILTFLGGVWRNRQSRRNFIAVAFLVGLYLLVIPAFVWQKTLERNLSHSRAKLKDLSVLIAEYRPIKERVDAIEQKKSLTKTAGITNAVNDIASEVGIKGKIKSVKGTAKGADLDRLKEEVAEIQLEKLTLAELVTLFYQIEKAPMILSVKRVQIRKAFENPERLDCTLSLALFTGE